MTSLLFPKWPGTRGHSSPGSGLDGLADLRVGVMGGLGIRGATDRRPYDGRQIVL